MSDVSDITWFTILQDATVQPNLEERPVFLESCALLHDHGDHDVADELLNVAGMAWPRITDEHRVRLATALVKAFPRISASPSIVTADPQAPMTLDLNGQPLRFMSVTTEGPCVFEVMGSVQAEDPEDGEHSNIRFEASVGTFSVESAGTHTVPQELLIRCRRHRYVKIRALRGTCTELSILADPPG